MTNFRDRKTETPTARSSNLAHFESAPRFGDTAISTAGTLVGGLLVVAAAIATAAYAAQPPSPDVSAQAEVVEQLPQEWRWERDAVAFDHMFRSTD